MTAPEQPVLTQIESAVSDGVGAVLVGAAGVGKTSLARTAAERLGGRFARVLRVTATAARRTVPFGAFAGLIDVPASGKTAALLQAAREALTGDVLLVVDEAQQLDPLSATLVYQLAVGGHTRLIVTAEPGGRCPDSVCALWTDAVLTRVDVEPVGVDAARLAGQIADYLAGLSAQAGRVLELLAVDEPLAVADLTRLAGVDALSAARDAGAVEVVDGLAYAAHPMFLDAVRRTLDAAALRRLRTELVERTEPEATVVGRLARAVLCLDSDRPQPVDDQIAAAAEALRLGDLALCERLGAAAAARDPGLAPRLPLAYALAWQGRGREAAGVLDEVDPAGLSEAELLAWALPRAANQFWMLSEPERATAFLRTLRTRLSPPAAVTVDALSATFAMNSGAVARAVQIAEEVLATPGADDTAIGWAAAAAALSCARMGRFEPVDALADRAAAAGQPGLLRFTSGFGQTTALLCDVAVEPAHRLAQELTDYAQLRQPGRAIGQVLVADTLLFRGDRDALDTAVGLLRDAAAALAPTGYSWGPLASMLLAQALGRLGEVVEAGKALSTAESRHGLKSMLFAPELALARAWTAAARRDRHGAVAAARDAARAAQRGGQAAVALRALHDAVRLGDGRAADAIEGLGLGCRYAGLALEHGRAVSAGDTDALRAVSARLQAAGLTGAASDAAAQGG